jgi:hypothetical protein
MEFNCSAVQHSHPQKYICKYKKLAKLVNSLFYLKQSEKEFDKPTVGNSEFV